MLGLNEVCLTANGDLPPEGVYVLVYEKDASVGGNDAVGMKWNVASISFGLSLEERAKLPETHPRKYSYGADDEDGNNKRAFGWHSVGPKHYFGQCITAWTHLPNRTEDEITKIAKRALEAKKRVY